MSCRRPELSPHLEWLFEFARPDRQHTKSKGLQRRFLAVVAVTIILYLLLPPPPIRRRDLRLCAAYMTVPETAMDENGESVLLAGEIGFPWEILHILSEV